MPPKNSLGGKYPSSFCEWVVGTTIENALASQAKKQPPKQRDIVRVEVTTDDETEEDSLKITYPRSGRTVVDALPADAVVKKVRFDVAPKKSALKKTVTVSSESNGEASDSATASGSDESSSEVERPVSSAKKQSKTKKTKSTPSNSDSDADSDPHPTCKCANCVRGREQNKKQAKTYDSQSSATESEASFSESDSSPKAKSPASVKSKAKGAKKSPEESEESQADDEASDSARVGLAEKRTKKAGANKNKKDSNAQGSKHKGQKVGDVQKQANADKGKPAKAENADGTRDKKEKGKTGSGRSRPIYPEAFLGPHPCRPNLIEPIRAEVVQTERVMERPEDPPPNAYYDPAHGVLRLYHGPVYGSAHSHALYPRVHASGPPLPIGTPHPTQGLYFHGPNQTPPPHSQAHAPFTQGMPMEPYSAMYPPPAFDPSHLSGYPRGGPPANWQEAGTQANGTRGAFSMAGAAVGSPSSRLQDKGGANNVAPGGAKAYENPYYTKRNLSQFSTYGNGTAPDVGQGSGVGSGPYPGVANGGLPSHDIAPAVNMQAENTQGASAHQENHWDVGDQQEPQSCWGAPEPQTQPYDQTNNVNGDTETNQQQGWNNNDTTDNGPPTVNDGGNVWGGSAQTDNPAPEANDNGMPGSFPSDMAHAPGGWQDPTAAASTGGLVDAEPSASDPATNGGW